MIKNLDEFANKLILEAGTSLGFRTKSRLFQGDFYVLSGQVAPKLTFQISPFAGRGRRIDAIFELDIDEFEVRWVEYLKSINSSDIVLDQSPFGLYVMNIIEFGIPPVIYPDNESHSYDIAYDWILRVFSYAVTLQMTLSDLADSSRKGTINGVKFSRWLGHRVKLRVFSDWLNIKHGLHLKDGSLNSLDDRIYPYQGVDYAAWIRQC